nr:hypothetical protein HmN_000736100 [Hymenolepis microstoma]
MEISLNPFSSKGKIQQPRLGKLVRKVQLVRSVVVAAATLLEPTLPIERLLKPRLSVRIENVDLCATPPSLAITPMVTRPSCSNKFTIREVPARFLAIVGLPSRRSSSSRTLQSLKRFIQS